MRQDKDRGSKWLLTHHGDAILRLGGIHGFTTWRPLANEKVAPRRLPDGLIEVQFPDRREPVWVLVEIESYPDASADQQVFEDLMVIALEHGVVPEVVSLILKPKGNQTVVGAAERTSAGGWTRLSGSWPVVRLWEMNAESLLEAGDPGLIPWVPLARSGQAPEELLAQCRRQLEKSKDPSDREGLMVVTEIFAGLAFPGLKVSSFFGGPEKMIESPVLDEVKEILSKRIEAKLVPELTAKLVPELTAKLTAKLTAELTANAMRDSIVTFLEARFGAVPPELQAKLAAITEIDRLKALHREAATCADLSMFMAGK